MSKSELGENGPQDGKSVDRLLYSPNTIIAIDNRNAHLLRCFCDNWSEREQRLFHSLFFLARSRHFCLLLIPIIALVAGRNCEGAFGMCGKRLAAGTLPCFSAVWICFTLSYRLRAVRYGVILTSL